MRIKKEYIFMIFLLGILFISGCGGETETTTEGYYNCHSGDITMIDAYFYEYAPLSAAESPYQAGEEIDIEVILENKMPEDIDAGKVKVRLKGDAAIDSIFSGAQLATSSELYGIDKDTCTVSEDEVELGPIVYEQDLTTEITKEIAGLYCYEHDVEIHGYLYFTEETSEVGTNLPAGSNPPSGVQVTSIEQNLIDVDGDTAEMRIKIYVQNVGTGTIVEGLDECFEYRELGYRETLHMEVDTAYEDSDCDQDIRLGSDDRMEIITCEVTGIDPQNLGPQASEITITLSEFAYEDEIASVDIWLEP
jgi:hypothetical protein